MRTTMHAVKGELEVGASQEVVQGGEVKDGLEQRHVVGGGVKHLHFKVAETLHAHLGRVQLGKATTIQLNARQIQR